PPPPTLFPYTTLFRSPELHSGTRQIAGALAAPVIRSSAYDGLLVSPKPPGDRVLRFFQLRGQRDALGAPVRYNRHDQRMPGFPRPTPILQTHPAGARSAARRFWPAGLALAVLRGGSRSRDLHRRCSRVVGPFVCRYARGMDP